MHELIVVFHGVMRDGHHPLDFEFNAAAIAARSSVDLAFALQLAEERARAAEQALREAQAARAQLEAELAQSELAKRELWREKTALANENDLLLARIGDLVRQLSEATNRDLQLQLAAEISTLQRRLDERNRSLFGTSSERRPRPDDTPQPEDQPRRKRRKRTGAKRTEQPELQIHPVHHRLEDDQLPAGCTACKGDLVEMAGQTEDSEEIDIQPIRYQLNLHRCHKYRCTCCGHILTAPGPVKLVPGGRYSIAFAAQVAVDKYEDALPLNRQVKRMRREGLEVTSQALWDQLVVLYLLLLPTLLAVHDRILVAPICFADETRWRMMTRKDGSKLWWLSQIVGRHLGPLGR